MKKLICLIRRFNVVISCDGKNIEVLGSEGIRDWIEELMEDPNSEYRQLVSNGTMDDPVMYWAASAEALEEFMGDENNFGLQFASSWTMDGPVVSPITSVQDFDFKPNPIWGDNFYFHYSEDNLAGVNEILDSDAEIGGSEGSMGGPVRKAASRAIEKAEKVGRKFKKFVETLGDLLRWRGR